MTWFFTAVRHEVNNLESSVVVKTSFVSLADTLRLDHPLLSDCPHISNMLDALLSWPKLWLGDGEKYPWPSYSFSASWKVCFSSYTGPWLSCLSTVYELYFLLWALVGCICSSARVEQSLPNCKETLIIAVKSQPNVIHSQLGVISVMDFQTQEALHHQTYTKDKAFCRSTNN